MQAWHRAGLARLLGALCEEQTVLSTSELSVLVTVSRALNRFVPTYLRCQKSDSCHGAVKWCVNRNAHTDIGSKRKRLLSPTSLGLSQGLTRPGWREKWCLSKLQETASAMGEFLVSEIIRHFYMCSRVGVL